MKKLTILTFFLVSPFLATSQEQITNFVSENFDKSSNPSDFIELNNKTIFIAEVDNLGQELWVTDGTNENTKLLKDINQGSSSGIPHFYNSFTRRFKEHVAILNNVLYFVAVEDDTTSGDLWKTDGTSEGTVKITSNIDFEIDYTNPLRSGMILTVVEDSIFFTIKRGSLLEVWKTDGTESGTVLVKNNIPVSTNTSLYRGKLNNLFIFSEQNSSFTDTQLWRSDGTEEGTFIIISGIDGNGSGPSGTSSLTQFIEYNNELFFCMRQGGYFGNNDLDIGITKTDGTVENTEPVQGLFNGNELMDFSDVIIADDNLYFSFFHIERRDLTIWKYDSNSETGEFVYDQTPSFSFMTSNLYFNGARLFFTGPGSSQTALLSMNLADNSIVEIKTLDDEIQPNYFNRRYYPHSIQKLNTENVFINQTTDANSEKRVGWTSDFTNENTTTVSALNNLPETLSVNENLYFHKFSESFGSELWISDGTNANTEVLKNINDIPFGLEPSNSSSNLGLNNTNFSGSKVIFSASDTENGMEPRSFNNVDNEVILLSDINNGSEGSSPGELSGYVHYNGNTYFAATNENNSQVIIKSDGTENGTTLLTGFPEGSNISQLSNFVLFNNLLYFTGRISSSHYLFNTDGTFISIIKNFGSGTNTFNMVVGDNRLFLYNPTFDGSQLWVSDGSDSGTTLLQTFRSFTGRMGVSNNNLYFSAGLDFDDEQELWVSDGTISGTQQLLDIGIGYSSVPDNFIALGTDIIFSAFTNEEGRELWKSNGTEEGTMLIKEINEGVSSSISINANLRGSRFENVDGFIFFSAKDSSNGNELWRTDGTEEGTRLVSNINPGNLSSNPSQLTRINDILYFSATTESEGEELWKTDGFITEQVTTNINPGKIGSVPLDILGIDEDLFFTATSSNSGRQLWKINNELLSLNETLNQLPIQLYPNPTTGIFELGDNIQFSEAKIVDLNGRLIKEVKANSQGKFDVSDLNSGIYIIHFNSELKLISRKLIKI